LLITKEPSPRLRLTFPNIWIRLADRMNRFSAIGAVVMCVSVLTLLAQVKFGPSGGNGGEAFDDPLPAGARVTGITVWHDVRIDGFQFHYITADGKKRDGKKIGGTGGRKENYPIQGQLVSIGGKYGKTVDSLELRVQIPKVGIVTNRFGGNGGEQTFGFPFPESMTFAGTFGRHGAELDALGIYLQSK
jgi:hypothetical protein